MMDITENVEPHLDQAFDELNAADENTEEVDDVDESGAVIDYAYDITSYGADYLVDGLVRRFNKGHIFIPRFKESNDEGARVIGFQREYIWSKSQADRFIESLLLGLPVPGIFLVKEKKERYLVLDGQQRIRTLAAFKKGSLEGKAFKLKNVQDRFKNKGIDDLDDEDRRRLDDSIIHATIVKQDKPTEDMSSIYMIFERLNTGGVNLKPQEIRIALYHGKFAEFLKKLNTESAWRSLYGRKEDSRLKDMELILRFFAFYYKASDYRAPMKNFLNIYMANNRNLQYVDKMELRHIFVETTSLLKSAIGQRAFRPSGVLINAAVVDSLMTGVARRLSRGSISDHDKLKRRHTELLSNEKYVAAIKTGTAQLANVKARMRLSIEAFSDIK